MDKYATRYDSFVKVVTNIVIIVELVLLAARTTAVPGSTAPGGAGLVITSAILLVAWGLSPRYYGITDSAVVIKRPFSAIEIPFEEITGVASVTEEDLKGSIRIFGSGGLFGYMGAFRCDALGDYQMWCTDSSTMVLIESRKKKYVISPADHARFIDRLNEKRRIGTTVNG